MKRSNNSHINNATLTALDTFANTFAARHGGTVTRNDMRDRDGNVWTDEALTAYHTAIYIARVEFSPERHNAVEFTATATAVYVAIGDAVAADIRDTLTGARETVRMAKWCLKEKRVFDFDALATLFTEKEKSDTTTEKSKSASKGKSTSKPRKSASKSASKSA
jgi:hypothetical protein